MMKNTNRPRTKNSAWENIDLFIQKNSEADNRLIDYQRARARTEMEQEQENEPKNSDHNIENLISEEAPKIRKITMKEVITLAIMMIMTIMIIMIIIMCQ